MPNRRWVEFSADWLDWSHQNLLAAVRATAGENLHRRPAPRAPSIAFHGWHMARWADRYQSAVPAWTAGRSIVDPADEIWLREDVVGRWGLRDIDTGDFGGTGAGLDDEASATLPLPDGPELLRYMDATFTAFGSTVRAIGDDAVLDIVVTDLYDGQSSIAEALADARSHADRHLGMIEALRGVLGDRGTVTI